MGAVTLVDYRDSNVGGYRELLLCPGAFEIGGQRALAITHIWVSTKASAHNGRRNWGLTKQVAAFDSECDADGHETVRVQRPDKPPLALTFARRGPGLPFNTRVVPPRRRTLTQPTAANFTALASAPAGGFVWPHCASAAIRTPAFSRFRRSDPDTGSVGLPLRTQLPGSGHRLDRQLVKIRPTHFAGYLINRYVFRPQTGCVAAIGPVRRHPCGLTGHKRDDCAQPLNRSARLNDPWGTLIVKSVVPADITMPDIYACPMLHVLVAIVGLAIIMVFSGIAICLPSVLFCAPARRQAEHFKLSVNAGRRTQDAGCKTLFCSILLLQLHRIGLPMLRA